MPELCLQVDCRSAVAHSRACCDELVPHAFGVGDKLDAHRLYLFDRYELLVYAWNELARGS